MPRFAVSFEIIPRASLTPAECQKLGNAILRWVRRHAWRGAGSSKDHDGGIEDLLVGRPVPTLLDRRVGQESEAERRAGLSESVDEAAVRRRLEDRGDDPDRRSIRLELFYLHDDRLKRIAIARRWIPAELVDDVLVNDRSWRDEVPPG